MLLDAASYVGRALTRDERAALRKSLREADETQRLELIRTLLVAHEKGRLGIRTWFRLANAVLARRASWEELLRTALRVADASTMRLWLEACVPRVGGRRTISILRESIPDPEMRVDKALYWLPRVVAGVPRTKLRELVDLHTATAPAGHVRYRS